MLVSAHARVPWDAQALAARLARVLDIRVLAVPLKAPRQKRKNLGAVRALEEAAELLGVLARLGRGHVVGLATHGHVHGAQHAGRGATEHEHREQHHPHAGVDYDVTVLRRELQCEREGNRAAETGMDHHDLVLEGNATPRLGAEVVEASQRHDVQDTADQAEDQRDTDEAPVGVHEVHNHIQAHLGEDDGVCHQ